MELVLASDFLITVVSCRINNIRTADLGSYTCIARNGVAKDGKNIIDFTTRVVMAGTYVLSTYFERTVVPRTYTRSKKQALFPSLFLEGDK